MFLRFLLLSSTALLAADSPAAIVSQLADSVPPEFAAAALLRLPPATPNRPDLLQRAFQLAANARHRLPVVAVPGVPADSRALLLSSARQHYDALSLQSNAVIQMAALQPARAREMFNNIPHSTPEPATCEDVLLADLGPYYDALAVLLRSAFTPEERQNNLHFAFAISALNRIASISELRPAARMVADLDWPASQLESAMASLEAAMKTHSTFSEFQQPDSRSYLASAAQIEKAMASIVARARRAGIITEGFSTSYRLFVVRQLRAIRCNDSDPELLRFQPSETKDLFTPAVAGSLPALGTQEVTPLMIEGEIKIERLWQSAASQDMVQDFRRFTRAPDGSPLPPATLLSEDWLKKAAAFTLRLEKWQPGPEVPEADAYHEKALFYESLFAITPPGALQGRLLSGFLALLQKKVQLRDNDPVEWSWHPRSFLAFDKSGKLADAFRNSTDPILALEAALR